MTTMAPREPVPAAVRGFAWYFRRLARRHFAEVHWSSADQPERWGDLPVLAVANHSTWWDGPLAFLLSERLGRGFAVAMEARHLARHPYFGWIGALPLRRTTPRERYADLSSIGAVLRPGRLLWLFPQGERRPVGAPIGPFERGAAHLALTHAPVRVVPVGIRLGFLSEQRPEAFLRLGPSQVIGPRETRDRVRLSGEFETLLRWTLEEMDGAIGAERWEGWQPLLQGTESVNKRLERLGRLLRPVDAPFQPRNG